MSDIKGQGINDPVAIQSAKRYLSNPADPDAFEGRAIVFDGPEDYHARIDDPALGADEHSILVAVLGACVLAGVIVLNFIFR